MSHLSCLEPLKRLFDRSKDCFQIVSLDGSLLFANPSWHQVLGYSPSDTGGLSFFDLVTVADQERCRQLLSTIQNQPSQTVELTLTTKAGRPIVVSGQHSLCHEPEKSVIWSLWQVKNPTHLPLADGFGPWQTQVLDLIACGASLNRVLTEIALAIENQCDDLVCSFVLLDSDGATLRPGAAPSLSEAYSQTIDGLQIGEGVGSCGTAAFRREPVIVADIATDPLWVSCRDVALKQGLRACWSTPILATESRVLGTFAIYHRSPRTPTPKELELINTATYLAKIAIERQLAEQALSQSEARYRAIVEDQVELICRYLPDTTITYANQSYCRLFQRTSSELVGQSFLPLIHPADREQVQANLATLTPDNPVLTQEIQDILLTGEVRWHEWTSRAFFDPQGRLLEYQSVGRDISDRKSLEVALRTANQALDLEVQERTTQLTGAVRQLQQEIDSRRQAEQALMQQDARYVLASQAGKVGVWDWNLETNELYLDPSLKEMLGYAPAEIADRLEAWKQLIHPEDQPGFTVSLQSCLTSNPSEYTYERRMLHRDGSVRWFLGRGALLQDKQGNPWRIMGTDTDITNLKLTEQALLKRERSLATLVEIQKQLLAADTSTHFYDRVLELLGQFSGAARVYVFENHWDAGYQPLTSQCAEWCAPGISPQHQQSHRQNLPYDRLFPHWATLLAQGECINQIVSDPALSEGLPLVTPGVVAILLLPLIVKGEFFGFIGFDNCTEARLWEPSEVDFFKAAAVALSLALERKRAREDLRSANAEMRALFAAMDELILVFDGEGRHLKIPSVNHHLLYKTVSERLGKTLYEVFSPEQADTFLAYIQTALRQQRPVNVEYSLVCNGLTRWSDASIAPIDHNRVMWVVRDATQRKQTEQTLRQEVQVRAQTEAALRASEERFREIAETIDEIFVIHSPDLKKILYISPTYEKIWKRSCESLYQNAESWMEPVHPEDLGVVSKSLDCIVAGKPAQVEYRIIQPDNTIRWIFARTFPVYDEAGRLLRHIGLVEDISDRKRVETEILKALEKAQELNELKSRFVSMISHEFRTPLTTIQSASELLEYYEWSVEEKQERFQQIYSAVGHMTQLLEDVLLIGRAEAGKLQLQLQWIDLTAFCQELVSDLVLTMGNQANILFATRGERRSGWVDPKLVRQILTNLLSNAVKYSPDQGEIHLLVQYEPMHVVFQVSDQGIGIPPQDQERLFEAFYRGVNVNTIQGTGLGLTIVKRCVDLHGGEVSVKSEIGSGTTFKVVLPLHHLPPTKSVEDKHGKNFSDRG